MPTLSVIMIAKNEADCLGACLESVREIAEEIVVADTGSTDGTIAIAQGFDAVVTEIPWEDDFAKARNAGMARATGDWLLHMDADEILDPGGAARIRALVDAEDEGVDAVEVMLANYCDDPRAWRWVAAPQDSPYAKDFSGYIAAPLLRLFRNHRGYEYREAIHENITESVVETDGNILEAPEILIHHYGFDLPESRTGDKARLYLDIALKKAEECPEDPKALHDFAEQALACGQAEVAEMVCLKVMEIDPLHLGGATTLSNILLNRGDLGEAKSLLTRLEDNAIRPPHVVMALGAVAYREGHIEEAKERLEAVLRVMPENVMARITLARVYDRLQAPDLARAELLSAQALVPNEEEFKQLLKAHDLRRDGEALFQAGDTQRALSPIVGALQLDPEDPLAYNDLGVILHSLGQDEKAREAFERALLLCANYPDAEENLLALG